MLSNANLKSIEAERERFLDLRTFTFFWRDGTSQVLQGETAAAALANAIPKINATQKMDFYVPGEPTDHIWDPLVKIWKYCRNRAHQESRTIAGNEFIEPILLTEPVSLVHRVASRTPFKPPRKMAMLSRIT